MQRAYRRYKEKKRKEIYERKMAASSRLEGLFKRAYVKTHTKLIKTVVYLLLEALQQREV